MTAPKRRWFGTTMTLAQRSAAERRIQEIEVELDAIRARGSLMDQLSDNALGLVGESMALKESLDDDSAPLS
jgi:hypothetical protein